MSEPPIEVLPSRAPRTPDHGPDSRAAGVTSRWFWTTAGALLLVAGAAVMIAWTSQQRVSALQQELVRRQQDSQGQAAEAHMIAKQAQDTVRETAAKLALLEARVAEVGVQRSQLEDLMQSLSRSRDENVTGDIEAGLRVAMQQTAITGSAEPLVAALKQADERLARYNEPRLEGVRRAIARDLDRVRAVGVADVPSLSIKLDEVFRMVDDLPLLSVAQVPRKGASSALAAAAPASATTTTPPAGAWSATWRDAWAHGIEHVWNEVKSLVRVTRIDNPEAMLLAPDQAFFVRENLKLRLMNARLALLSRQFDTAQMDLRIGLGALDRYFDRSSRRTVLAIDLLKQVSAQARHVGVPRPDDTLAALTAASAGR